MQKILTGSFRSISGNIHEISIYDLQSNEPDLDTTVLLESPGYTLSNNANITEYVKGGIIESSVTFTIRNIDKVLNPFLEELSTSPENRYIIEIKRNKEPFWKGVLLNDFSNRPDLPQEGVEFTATDGFLILDKILATTSNAPSLGNYALSLLKTIIVGLRQIPTVALWQGDDVNFILVLTNWYSQTMIDYPQIGYNPPDDPMERVIFAGSSMWQKVTEKQGYNGKIVKSIEPLTYREVIQHILERFNAILVMDKGVWTIAQRELLKDGEIDFKAYRKNYIFQTSPHVWRGYPFVVTKDFKHIITHQSNPTQKYRSNGNFSYLPALKSVEVIYGGGNLADGFPSLIPAKFGIGQHYYTMPVSSGEGNYLHLRVKFTENFVIDYNGISMPQMQWSQYVQYTIHVKQGDKFLMNDGTWKNQVGGRCTAFGRVRIYCTDLESWTFAYQDYVEIDKEWFSQGLPYADTELEIWITREIGPQTSQDAWIKPNSQFNYNPDAENHFLMYVVNNETPVNHATFKAENPDQNFVTEIELTPSLFGSARVLSGATQTILHNNLFSHAGMWGVGEDGVKDKYFNAILVQETMRQQQINLLIYNGDIYDRDTIKPMSPLHVIQISKYEGSKVRHFLMTPNHVVYSARDEMWTGDWIEISTRSIQPYIPPVIIDNIVVHRPDIVALQMDRIENIVNPDTGDIDTTGGGLFPHSQITSGNLLITNIDELNPPALPESNDIVHISNVNGEMTVTDYLGNIEKLGTANNPLECDPESIIINDGFIYNSHVAENPKLCNGDWRVPSQIEFQNLIDYLISIGCNYDDTFSGNKIAKAMASEIEGNWQTSTNVGSVGSSDFPNKRNITKLNIKGAGLRTSSNFENKGEETLLLSRTTGGMLLSFESAEADLLPDSESSGSIRLMREVTGAESTLPDFTEIPDVYTGNDGKMYGGVKINNLIWLTSNLAETKFNDGTEIPYCTSQEKWNDLTMPLYCAYQNDISIAHSKGIQRFKDNISLKETTLISTFKEISHNYYLNEQDNILQANQDLQIFLPSANSVKGKKFTILTEQISKVDIIAKTGEFIDSTQYISLSAYRCCTIISTGTNWRILSLK